MKIVMPLVLVLAFALPGAAATTAAGGARQRLASLRTDSVTAYAKNRAAWIEELRAHPAAREELRTLAFDDGEWRDALIAEAFLMTASEPEIDLHIQKLRGLDPQHYLRKRRPQPAVQQELTAARLPAPVLVEHYLAIDALVPRTAADRYPSHVGSTRRDELHAAERLALQSALLVAIGLSGDGRAARLVEDVALDPSTTVALRRVAAAAVAHAASPRAAAVLRAMIDGPAEAVDVVTGAVAAAGFLRTEGGLDVLRAACADPRPEVRGAAVLGLSSFANARAGTRGGPESAELREAAATDLLAQLDLEIPPSLETPLTEALAAADHERIWTALDSGSLDAAASAAALRVVRELHRHRSLRLARSRQ